MAAPGGTVQKPQALQSLLVTVSPSAWILLKEGLDLHLRSADFTFTLPGKMLSQGGAEESLALRERLCLLLLHIFEDTPAGTCSGNAL